MEEKYFFLFVVFLFVISLVSSAQISSSNYNIDANVVSSGGTKTNSSNFMSKLVLGILSGASSSINFNNFLGLFYGADTTEPVIEIKFPVQDKLYNVFIGDLNYTVDATSLYCWYSKDNGLTNSTPVVARTNWTNIYSRTVTGKNNWTIYCNDSAGNIGKAFVNFLVDDKVPNVYFSGSTPIDNEILQDSFFTINVTSSDESGEHSTFLDFNDSLVGWWKLEERIDLSPSIRTFTPSHHSGRTTSSLEYIESPIINDFSIKVQGLTSGLDSAYTLTSDYIDIVPNKAYTFSFYYKTNSTSVTYMEARASGHTSKIMWYDASNNLIRFDNLGSNKPIVRNTWQQFNITSTSPSNAVRCKVAIGQDSPNFETGDISYVLYPELKETYFYDSSNYNNHGICAGSSCPSVTGGKRGLAYEFDGVDDYIEISHDENFAPTSITVSGWVKLKSSTLWMLVNKAHGTTPGSYYIYGTNINDAKWSITDSTATRHTSSLGSLSLDTWYFLVGTYDDNTGIMRSYKNGELIDSKTGVGLGLNTDNLLIGKYVSQYNFNGSIDDVMIFNRALSENEIKSIYNAQSKQYGNLFQNVGNGEYNYTVYSQDLAGNVNSSTRKLTVNMAPTGLNVSVLEDKNLNSEQGALNLTWIDSSVGEEGFSIERSPDNSTFAEINRTSENIITYTDDNLPDNSIFFYKLRSFTGGAYSSYSNIAHNITADRTPPLNPLITLFPNSTANGVNVKIDDTNSGLILYLPFEERTGTTAYDWSGEENHGIIYGATYADGNEGNGKTLKFDGVDDKILLDKNIQLKNNIEWTVSAMIRTTKAGMNSIMSNHNSGPVYSAFITNNGKIAYHYYNGAWLTASGNIIINDGNWHHLVWKHHSNNSMEFYVDGIKDGSTFNSAISGSSTNPIDIIGQAWSGSSPFNGSIDEVRIYNRTLTQREIINDMQSGLVKHKLYVSERYNGDYLDVNNPIVNGYAEFGNLTNFAFDGITNDAYEGNYAFYETGYKDLQSLYLIPIDNNSEYVLSGMFKSNGTGGLSKLYFGFVPYDKNKDRISVENINVVLNTETELYEDIEPTDKIIKIKNCTNWVTSSSAVIAFNIDDSGNYADLPNRELSNGNIIAIIEKDGYCEVEFNTTVGISYPAKTKIRRHAFSATYMYSAANAVNVPITWTQYSTSKMKGSTSFWPGTKYVKILFLLNYQQGSSYTTLVDNIKLTVNNGSISNSYYLSPASTDRAHPSNVTNLTSEDVKESNFYTTNEATFTWNESIDYGTNYSFYLTTEDKAGNYNNTRNVSNSTNVITGIAGYSVLCDDWKNSIPNNIIDVVETNYTCSLTEGENYFFVKAIDGAGNSGNITRFGPFFVDTGVPNIYFVPPTPVNATQTIDSNTTVKVEIKDYSLSDLNFTWGNTIFEVLGHNLVLLLNFQNLKTLGENNTLAKDLTKYGNDALLHGATYLEDGKYGKSVSLNGVNNYLSTNISQSKGINVTMSAWVKSNKLLHQSIISQAKGLLHYRGIRLTETGISFWARDSGTTWQDSIYEIDYINKWVHVVGVQEGNELKLYINGELVSTKNMGSNSGELSENFEIGRYTTGDYYFNGTIDEIKIYNRSLSNEEVKLLYDSNIQRHSQTDWSLTMNLTNLSRGNFQYNSSACDMTNNCNSTETRVWSRLNIPPIITNVKINMTNGIMRATQNMSIVELASHDLDPEDGVFNITDWRENNQSIALLNMPFEGGSDSLWTKDYSKNSNHGTVNGATWTTNGKVGGAYQFNGVNDYISLPFGQEWNISQTNPLTISMWVKPNTLSPNQMIFHTGPGSNQRLYIGQNSGTWDFGIQSSGWASSSIPTTIDWQYIVLSMDGTKASLYVNGEYKKQKSYSSFILVDDFYIGSGHGGSYPFNGTIDEVMIFNRSMSEEQIKLIYQAGLNNHSLENISSNELKDRERWKVVVTPNDLIEDGEPLESNELYLYNNLPVVTLNYPLNNSEIINRTPEFNWTGYDSDGDPLTYQLEIKEEKGSGTGICDDDISRNNLNQNKWIATQDLKCLGDYGYYYQWRVRAHDGESFGEWTPYNKFTLNAYVVISLLNSEVNFGTIDYLGSNNTSNGNPQPFVIKNSGNVKINISANSTPMWQSEQDDSKYYKTKADYRAGFESAFNWISSIVEWINMSITGRVTLMDQLDYHESNNTAEVDIHLEVPPNEGPGLKSATVIFEAKFSEDEA